MQGRPCPGALIITNRGPFWSLRRWLDVYPTAAVSTHLSICWKLASALWGLCMFKNIALQLYACTCLCHFMDEKMCSWNAASALHSSVQLVLRRHTKHLLNEAQEPSKTFAKPMMKNYKGTNGNECTHALSPSSLCTSRSSSRFLPISHLHRCFKPWCYQQLGNPSVKARFLRT